jgi:hypothetical protein
MSSSIKTKLKKLLTSQKTFNLPIQIFKELALCSGFQFASDFMEQIAKHTAHVSSLYDPNFGTKFFFREGHTVHVLNRCFERFVHGDTTFGFAFSNYLIEKVADNWFEC